jgi:chromodomain-helicase-DNA-binding protein 4
MQEHVMKTILFILSVLPDACQPFLLLTNASLPLWEAEFSRFAPSINIIVYDGEKDVHKLVQNPEFHENGRHTMLHVILAHPDAILEVLCNDLLSPINVPYWLGHISDSFLTPWRCHYYT